MVYVFNCSEQMDYKSCGNIFKGLSLTGAWGCFDGKLLAILSFIPNEIFLYSFVRFILPSRFHFFFNSSIPEFNRISVEVLSVVAVQVKSILNAIKTKRERFNFMGETINLIPTIGMFITMNPGKYFWPFNQHSFRFFFNNM